MAPVNHGKRKLETPKSILKSSKPYKKPRHAQIYHSSSEDEEEDFADFAPVDLAEVENVGSMESSASEDTASQDRISTGRRKSKKVRKVRLLDGSSQSSDNESSAKSSTSSSNIPISSKTSSKTTKSLKNRNNPVPFATSLSTILASNSSQQAKPAPIAATSTVTADPILSRSTTAASARKSFTDDALRQKAQRAMTSHRRLLLEKGRVKDALLGTDDLIHPLDFPPPQSLASSLPDPQPRLSAEEFQAKERALKKTAQRGVVRLFNAVRAAQKRGEEAETEAREKGLVGRGRREEKVGEMSREGFLSFVAQGGRKEAEKEVGDGE